MNENHYYVNIPGQDFPSAEVEAASTKHARTAYLDYLSRNEYIGWRERQAWRSKTVTKRMKYPGEIKTQVYLDYNGIPALTQDFEESPVEAGGPAMEMDELAARQRGISEAIEEEEQEGRGIPSVLPRKNPWGNSPVMDLSKRSRGA